LPNFFRFFGNLKVFGGNLSDFPKTFQISAKPFGNAGKLSDLAKNERNFRILKVFGGKLSKRFASGPFSREQARRCRPFSDPPKYFH